MKNRNRRLASLIVCLSIVINCMVVYNTKKADMISHADDNRRATMLNEKLKENKNAISSLGLSDTFGLDNDTIDYLIFNGRVKSCENVYDVTMQEVFEQIKENTEKFVLDDFALLGTSFFDEEYFTKDEYRTRDNVVFSTGVMKKIGESAYDSLRDYISYVLENGNNGDIHNLMGLKIIFVAKINRDEPGVILGRYSKDNNLIKICLPNIIGNSTSTTDVSAKLNDVLKHELNHMRQYGCEDTDKYNILTQFSSNNSLSLLAEASAESGLYNLDLFSHFFKTSYVYPEYRMAENVLFLCSLFNDSKIDDYYNAIYNQDMDAFFNFFSADSIEEKREIFRVIYAMDAVSKRNSYVRSLVGLKTSYDEEDYDAVALDIKNLEYITIFKITINNLIDYNINNSDLTLEDNILLYKMITMLISESAFKVESTSDGKKAYYLYDEFVDQYQVIQDNFLQTLSTIYSVSTDEILEMYNKYNSGSVVNEYLNWSHGNRVIYFVNDKKYDSYLQMNKLVSKFSKIKEIIGNSFYYTDLLKEDYLDLYNDVSKGRILVKD